MTLGTLISKVTLLRPSEYDKDELTQWVNEVEFMAYDQVIGMAEPPFPPGMMAAKDPVTVYPVKPGTKRPLRRRRNRLSHRSMSHMSTAETWIRLL